MDKRHIVKYLIEKGITKNVYDTYKNLIGVGTDLYIPLKKISPSDIISKIDSCGGISVLAHPFTIDKNLEKLEVIIKELIDYGLVGIEVINGKNPREFQLQYELLAKKFNLIKTVGSDFHDINLSSIGIDYDEEIIDILHEKIYSKNNI